MYSKFYVVNVLFNKVRKAQRIPLFFKELSYFLKFDY